MRAVTLSTLLLAGCAPPAPALGEGVTVSAPRPGRYTAIFEHDSGGCCSQSCGATHTRAMLRMTLDPGGQASLCRAREGITATASGGPGVEATAGALYTPPSARREETRLDERRSMRGTWRREGAWVRVDLAPDRPDGAAKSWALRCVDVAPQGGRPAVPMAMLACEFMGDAGVEGIGYTACASPLYNRIFLSADPGLVVRSRELGLSGCGEATFERRAVEPVPGCAE
jgi:hypothetical protein